LEADTLEGCLDSIHLLGTNILLCCCSFNPYFKWIYH